MAIGQDLLNVPMGDMILQMALSIAESQFELDKSSIMVAEMMGGQRLLRDEEGRLIDYDGQLMASKRDSSGNPTYDERGNLEYEDGHGPRVIDSRVFFGYTYEPMLDANGAAQTWPNGATKMVRKPKLVSMMELGFTPNFYQFVDSIIEVKIAISMSQSTDETSNSSSSNTSTTTQDLVQTVKTGTSRSFSYRNARWGRASYTSARGSQRTNYKQIKTGTSSSVSVQSVDATYANKYNYTAEGASLLRTKLVPVPPPAVLEDRIRQVMESEKAYQELAAQGLHGMYEKLADDTQPIVEPKGTMAKHDRSIGDKHLVNIGGTKAFLPDGRTLVSTGTYTSNAASSYTFVVPASLKDAQFTLAVAAGAGAIDLSYNGATTYSVAAGGSKVITLTGGTLAAA